MALLDEVVNYKKYADSQNNATADAVPQMLQSFIAGKQQRRENLLNQFKVEGELAQKGLRVDQKSGTIIRDPALSDPLAGWKAADYASKVGYRSMLSNFYQGAVNPAAPATPGTTGGAPASGPMTSAPAPGATGATNVPAGGAGTPGAPATGFGTFLKGFGINGPQIGMDNPQDQAQRSGNLRKELMDSSFVKSYRELSKYSGRLDAALASGQEGAGKAIPDQALITLFNKMLDENSVVRESEYARTPEGLSVLNRMEGYLSKLNKGGSGITNQERYDIIRVSKKLLDSAGDAYDGELDRYSDLAKSDTYKVDPKGVLGGLKYSTPRFDSEEAAQAAADAGELKDGQKVKIGGQIATYRSAE